MCNYTGESGRLRGKVGTPFPLRQTVAEALSVPGTEVAVPALSVPGTEVAVSAFSVSDTEVAASMLSGTCALAKDHAPSVPGALVIGPVPCRVPASPVAGPVLLEHGLSQQPAGGQQRHSDGCSGGISLFWRLATGAAPDFEYCCQEHDVFYEQGGSRADRLFADRLFKQCMLRYVSLHNKPRHAAWLFYVAVRLFGWLFWNKKLSAFRGGIMQSGLFFFTLM